MEPKDVFFDYLSEHFYPRLKSEGFRGSRSTMRRPAGDCIHVASIQGWRYGGERSINVGLAFAFLPDVDPERVTAIHCEFIQRLGATLDADHWFQFGRTPESARKAATEMVEVFFSEAPAFFERFGKFPSAYAGYTPECILHRSLDELPPIASGWRAVARYAWFFARMWSHLGDKVRAQEFARLGLRHLERATGLRDEFESILHVA
jgi:hypothetical protein